MRRRWTEATCALSGCILAVVTNVSSAAVQITGTQLVTNVNGVGTVVQDTYVGSALVNPSDTLVASQNGTLSYLAKREGDPYPASTDSVEKTLCVSLLVGSTPVLLKNPKFVWDLQHTNSGGHPQFLYQSLAEMTLDLRKFLDPNNNNIYDSGETLESTGVGAAYIISGLDNGGSLHASGVVSDLSLYGTGIVEALLIPDAHYVLFLRYGMNVNAPDISSNPVIPSIMATFDAIDGKYLGPQWTFTLQLVPEPSTVSLLLIAPSLALLSFRRLRTFSRA